MNDPIFLSGAIVGSLVAGGVCGMLPMSLALKRERIELGVCAMVMCLLSGLAGGLIAALPAALVCTAAVAVMSKPKVTMFRDAPIRRGRDESYVPDPIDWTALDPDGPPPTLPAVTAPVPRSRRPIYEQERSASRLPAITCSECGGRVVAHPDAEPLWCPRCGADLKLLTTLGLKEQPDTKHDS